MARYYESKTLIEFVKKYTPHINGETTMECIERAIREAPTADVVPKSEYDAAIIDRNAARLGMIAEHERLKTARAEVAREIFEELRKKIKASITIHLEEINKEYIVDTPLYDRHSGVLFALQRMDDFIAELKKKYTEGKT